MEQIIKSIVRVGNSAGVVLPLEWLHGVAKIELMRKPLDVKREILEILEPYLHEIVGIYLVGSYARGEVREGSDVDVLVITNQTNKRIKHGAYEIILISLDKIEATLKRNAMPLLPMLLEAKTIINEDLLKEYANLKLNKENLKSYFELTDSALKICEGLINLDKEEGQDSTGVAIAYSLVLRLRGAYIVDCLIKNKMWSTKGLLALIKKIAGSLKAYEGYLGVKDDKSAANYKLNVVEAEKLIVYIRNKLKEHEKWVKKES